MENLVGYAQRDLMVPLETAQFGDAPLTPAAVDEAAAAWSAQVTAQQHSEICADPAHLLAHAEAPLLGVLPLLRPPAGATLRKVDRRPPR